jgi:hypothetical protein
MNLMADYEYRIEVSSDRFKGIIMSCLMLPYHPVTLQYRIEAIGICDEDIFLNDPLFGPIGKIEIRYQATSQTLLSFINPGYPELSDVANYLPQLKQIQLDYQTRVRLWMSQDQPEKVIAQMQPVLHQVRQQRHREIREWLFSRLRIFGYRNLISQVSPGMDPETFHFPIQATCAQLAVLARRISREWEEKTGPMPACLVQDPETFYAVGNVLPDFGPLNVILTKKNGALKCMIQSISYDSTAKRVAYPAQNGKSLIQLTHVQKKHQTPTIRAD